jgi:general secretion pathway protein D
MSTLRYILGIVSIGVVAIIPPAAYAGSGGESSLYTIENDADREIARRQQELALAEEALRRGDAALKAGNVEQAYLAYKQAVDFTPDGPTTRSLRARALSRYSSTAVRYAEFLVSEGQYAKAEAVAREVLEPRYNPNYQPAAVFLSRLEQPDYFNKTITPEFAEDRVQVEKLLQEANGYFDSGRYDLAQKRYEQVLSVDKYNAAAFRGMEQVEVGKQRYYDSAYNETRSRMLWQVDKAWERPKRRFVEARTTDSTALDEERRGTELMVGRLNRIIIPRVDFRDATVRQAVGFLQQRSRDLDTSEADPERRGINIVVKLPASVTPPPATLEVEGETPAAPVFSGDNRITLNLSNVPLYEALRYVATLAGLKVKVEPFAVSLVPLSEPTDVLEQREFKVPPGFITGVAGGEADAEAVAGRQLNTDGPRLGARQGAKDFLESQGIDFPAGTSANFNAGTSRLVVRNTAENLDLIESLVDAAMGAQPTQVEIEAKFVEISQNNLKELGFDWALGPFSIGDSGLASSGGTIIPQGQAGQWPFVNPGTGGVVGGDSITSGLRSGSGTGPDAAVSVNSLNALLAQNAGVTGGTGPAPGFFSISGVFTNPQFQMVIRALNQKKGVDLMAAPKVTTKSGEKATISISREFPYPENYAPPQVPQNTGTGSTGTTVNVLFGAQREADPVVTPSFPENFVTRQLGVSLVVEPVVGPDGYTIDLKLSPEVVDFDGFINYGTPIFSPANLNVLQGVAAGAAGLNPVALLNPAGQVTAELLTENVINQPIFSVRKVTTDVSIWDGQTVALGGLIREDVQKVNDKVPVLGDIPYAGALFRSEVDQKIKQNLIVFVTARLMDAAGQPLRPEDDTDQEEIVEPLGLPEDLRKPSINAKGFRQK